MKTKISFLYIKHSYLLLILVKYWIKRIPGTRLRLFIKPKQTPVITYPKAPMAHKKQSKEQFSRLMYSIYIKLTLPFSPLLFKETFYYFFLMHELFSLLQVFETPLLLLSYIIILLPAITPHQLCLTCFRLYDEIGRHARLKTSSERVLVRVQV